MEKRFLLALALSIAVMTVWSIFFAPTPEELPEDTGGPAGATGPGGEAVVDVDAPPPVPEDLVGELVSADEEREEVVLFGVPGEDGHYRAVFSNRGGRLVELRSGDHWIEGTPVDRRDDPSTWLPLLESFEQPDGRTTGSLLLRAGPGLAEELVHQALDDALWVMSVDEDENGPVVRFTYAPGTGVAFTKTVRRVPGRWELAFELGVENVGAPRTGTLAMSLTPAGCVPPELEDRFYVEPTAAAAGRAGEHPDDMRFDDRDQRTDVSPGDVVGGLSAPGPLAFAGVHNKYFACLLRGAEPASEITLAAASYRHTYDAEWARANPDDAEDGWRSLAVDVALALTMPADGSRQSWGYVLYAGPKDEAFEKDYPPHALVVEEDLGFFSFIGHLLLIVLRAFHSLTGNWGVAIILLTLCVRTILFPFNRRSQTAMARYQKKMKRVQPKLEESKKKYADDPKKQREEQARIMQEEGAFPPLGGCLPIFFQIPIFFALFGMLRTVFDLRQAPFAGWVQDLSRPDRLMRLDLELPLFLPDLEYLNVLPILMVVLWVLQQMGMPKPADPQAARMQKMMMFMPVVMGIFLYDYASGLSLYMCTQSLLGIIELRVIKKLWPVDDTEVVKKKSGCGPFSGFMEKVAEAQKQQMKRVQEQQRSQARTNKNKAKRKKR